MPDYAPLYSKRERIRMVLFTLVALGLFFLFFEYWFMPWLDEYVRFANCRVYYGYTGIQVLLYAMFVGAPLSLGLFFVLWFGPYTIRVLKWKQDPPPGMKVLRKTRIRYGAQAMLRPIALLAVIVFFVATSIWGGIQVEKMSGSFKPCSEEQLRELRQRKQTEN